MTLSDHGLSQSLMINLIQLVNIEFRKHMETSGNPTKVMSDCWYRGHPKRKKNMHGSGGNAMQLDVNWVKNVM